jgi:glycosyltransferase involved in cell wall biosynthesis
MANIWLINHDASTPSTGMGGRHHYFARSLAAMGHKVTLIAARKHHLLRERLDTEALPAEEAVSGYRFLRLDVPGYANAHDKRRVIAWSVFAARLWAMRVKPEERPDVVLYSSPQLLGFLGAERLARRYGARLVFEVRDIWPLTLVEIGGFSPNHPVIRFFQWIEDRAYARAERVVSNLEGAVAHMAARGLDDGKFTWISNGIDLDEVQNPAPLSPEIAARIPLEGLRIVYTGTLGAANALDTLLDAAALLRDLPDVSILLVGQGRARAALEARCDALGLNNVRFLGPVPKVQVQSVLVACDVCYIGWKTSALYRWGIAANKLPEYLFAGNPIIHGFTGGNDPVAKFDAGITVPAQNPQALANMIRRLRAMPATERRRMGENGRRAALEHYDYTKLAKRLEQVLLGDFCRLTCNRSPEVEADV